MTSFVTSAAAYPAVTIWMTESHQTSQVKRPGSTLHSHRVLLWRCELEGTLTHRTVCCSAPELPSYLDLAV